MKDISPACRGQWAKTHNSLSQTLRGSASAHWSSGGSLSDQRWPRRTWTWRSGWGNPCSVERCTASGASAGLSGMVTGPQTWQKETMLIEYDMHIGKRLNDHEVNDDIMSELSTRQIYILWKRAADYINNFSNSIINFFTQTWLSTLPPTPRAWPRPFPPSHSMWFLQRHICSKKCKKI